MAPSRRARSRDRRGRNLRPPASVSGGVNRSEPGGRAMTNVVGPRAVLPAALALVLALAGTAQALNIGGTPGNDRIRGSNQADTIDAQAGNDRVRANAGDDSVR